MWLGGSRRRSGMLAGGSEASTRARVWTVGSGGNCYLQGRGMLYPNHKIGTMFELDHWSIECPTFETALSSGSQQQDAHLNFHSLRHVNPDSAKYMWNLNWASLGLPMGLRRADASMHPPETGVVGTVQVSSQLSLQRFCSSMLEHQLTAKLDKRVEVEDLCISGGTRGIAQSKAFSLILSSRILSGLEVSCPPPREAPQSWNYRVTLLSFQPSPITFNCFKRPE